MSQKIFFFHNPKAGGASLRRVFESHFLPEKRCPIIENNKVEHEELGGDYTRFRGYDLYAGHYGRDIFVTVNDGHSCVTNFRHPIARLLSLYNFFRFSVELTDERAPHRPFLCGSCRQVGRILTNLFPPMIRASTFTCAMPTFGNSPVRAGRWKK